MGWKVERSQKPGNYDQQLVHCTVIQTRNKHNLIIGNERENVWVKLKHFSHSLNFLDSFINENGDWNCDRQWNWVIERLNEIFNFLALRPCTNVQFREKMPQRVSVNLFLRVACCWLLYIINKKGKIKQHRARDRSQFIVDSRVKTRRILN